MVALGNWGHQPSFMTDKTKILEFLNSVDRNKIAHIISGIDNKTYVAGDKTVIEYWAKRADYVIEYLKGLL